MKFREDKKDNPLSKSVHTFVVDVAENVEIHVVEPISRKYVVSHFFYKIHTQYWEEGSRRLNIPI